MSSLPISASLLDMSTSSDTRTGLD
jgi:hypothetical protein